MPRNQRDDSLKLRILILGGYGTFGGRLAQLLADDSRLCLIIAGRSREKAEAFIRNLPRGCETIAAAVDREADLAARLGDLAPDIVVDASGPFQAYGDDPYRVVRACLAARVSYLDLADGSDFVAGIARFDAEARQQGVFILSGVSSFPVLTAAVVRAIAGDVSRIDSIVGGVAPSPFATVGRNVIRAISSYAGKPVAMIRDGRETTAHGLTETLRFTISPPGREPLRNTLFSLVDVPDLKVVPELFPGVGTVWIGAGPTPEIFHRALIGLAWLVRVRIVPTLAPLAPLFHVATNTVRWGKPVGGMFIDISGERDGAPVRRSWHMIAAGDDGPLIPSMAAAAVIRRCLAGRTPAAGARSGAGDIELADYEPFFCERAIVTGVRETTAATAQYPLYRRILGTAWNDLPPSLRAIHDIDGRKTAAGKAEVERGKGLLARAVAAMFGFPKAGRDIPVTVELVAETGGERWQRDFAGNVFSSAQTEGRGRNDGLLVERFGPFSFALAVVVERERLSLVLRSWTFLGIPMPKALSPRTEAFEYEEDERFRFHIAIAHPLAGLIVRYRGWLAVT